MNFTILRGKNPRFANENKTHITLDVDFKELPEEWLSYTCCANDIEAHSRELYRKALDKEYGEIGKYVAPLLWQPVERTTVEVSTQGLVQLLLEKGLITDEEVDTLLYEKTETVGFARTTVEGNDGDVSDKIWC